MSSIGRLKESLSWYLMLLFQKNIAIPSPSIALFFNKIAVLLQHQACKKSYNN